MRKTHKGTTLVEVLVSIAVFAILSVAVISCLLGMTKIVSRQEEYVRFEMILSDMEFYFNHSDINSYFQYETEQSDKCTVYFTDRFVEVTNDSNRIYALTYRIDGSNLIVENIKHISGRVILENITILKKISEVQQ